MLQINPLYMDYLIKSFVSIREKTYHITKYGGNTMLLSTKQDMILMNRIRCQIGGMMLI